MKKSCLIIIFLFSIISIAAAQTETGKKESRDDVLTYAGVSFAYGMNTISYSDWQSSARKTTEITGQSVMPGIAAAVCSDYFTGEFAVSGALNFNSTEDSSIHFTEWSGLMKIQYPFNPEFFFTAGLGLYLETFPSTKSYEGGGITSSLGMYYIFSEEYRIAADGYFRYGYYGLGEESYKLNYGIRILFLKQVGRL